MFYGKSLGTSPNSATSIQKDSTSSDYLTLISKKLRESSTQGLVNLTDRPLLSYREKQPARMNITGSVWSSHWRAHEGLPHISPSAGAVWILSSQ